ncbi:MAG TPA: FtsW/RodA/SpoVE family cell cycle protein, partial [Mycobacterium sp.]|nr:FtsW/RodA/SpoVE family cell cycle protein [Mycobacterium sp.]
MGVLRAEPARVQQWASRSIAVGLRAYDVQLTIYGVLLVLIGLSMAYSNSTTDGSTFTSGSTFMRGLMWAAIAGTVFLVATAFDYKWLKTFAWPLYFVNLALLAGTLAVGSGVGGAARWVTILGACLLMGPPLVLVMMQPDLGTSLVFAAILAGMLFMSGASLRWLSLLALGVVAAVPVAWTHVLRDYQKQRLISFLDPSADPQGSGYQLLQSQIAVGSGGPLGKGLTNGTQ